MLFSQQILELIRNGIGETLCMVIISTVISYMIGIPLGIILVVTDKEGIRPFLHCRRCWDLSSTCSGRCPSLFF